MNCLDIRPLDISSSGRIASPSRLVIFFVIGYMLEISIASPYAIFQKVTGSELSSMMPFIRSSSAFTANSAADLDFSLVGSL